MLTRRLMPLLLLCGLAVAGCAAPRNVRVAPLYADDPYWHKVSQKQAERVLVTEGDLRRKYKPIARIFVDSTGWDKRLSFERMREEGAKVGADAVIRVRVASQYEGQDVNLYTGQNYGPRNRHTLEGLAVIYEPE